MKERIYETLILEKIVGGGQTLGTLSDGRKAFVWGGLPEEEVTIRVTKKKSKFVEGIVTKVHKSSPERVEPRDPDSYLSTSPWQIMNFDDEQHYKCALIEEAYELHDIVLPNPIEIYSDNVEYGYRNKIEFNWYGDVDASSGADTLDLAFFHRASKGKLTLDGTSLAHKEINACARNVRDILRAKQVSARLLKTLMIRCDQTGKCVFQLYVKDESVTFSDADFDATGAAGGEIIYSEPRSPASRITKRLQAYGETVLQDTILDVPFRYAAEGFFQINLPVYEQALSDMKTFVDDKKPLVDLYSGVGTIGLTIAKGSVTLVEINEDAVREMRANIESLGRAGHATAIFAASEKALDVVTAGTQIVVDPPRAGLHQDVIDALLSAAPARIIYLSCNATTQARDVALLAEKYGVLHHKGYNFFPRTPHIEHLVVLDLKP